MYVVTITKQTDRFGVGHHTVIVQGVHLHKKMYPAIVMHFCFGLLLFFFIICRYMSEYVIGKAN